MSFRDRVTFSMVASRERQHGDRLPKLAKYNTRVLPLAAIYGGNASGKTNFFKALNFVKTLVVKGTQPDSYLAVDGFRLDEVSTDRPSHFALELLIDDIIYELSFTANRKVILEEKLVMITSTSERVLYERLGEAIRFDASLKKDQFLQFAFKGTRSNQLFLTNSVSQKVNNFRGVYDWFKDTLDLVAPDSRFEPFEQFLDDSHPLYSTMNELLPQLDTGITHLGGEQIPFENIALPEAMKVMLQEEIKEGMTIRLMSDKNDRFVFTRKSGELTAQKLVTFHPKANGALAKFEIRQESDGSQRVIDLLPAFLELATPGSKKVFVIDELDRSLHTLLTRRLLQAYLASCSAGSRSQLLLTTHDVLLMDQDLLRRDEMWIAERKSDGASILMSFAEYKDVRYDKDIRKSYLQGRLGGIPQLLLGEHLLKNTK
ncbi:AAA family ATPase [Orrella daihaiensis]